MALPRKDIRAKLDHEVHEALVVICDATGVDLGEFVEREIERAVRERVHAAQAIASRAPQLGITGKPSGKAGSGRE